MPKNGKSPNGKSGKKSGTLVAQPHGGKLKAGGDHWRPGRPPSEIREAARLAFAERIPVLTRIVDSDESRDLDRIGAMKVLADSGGVDKIALTTEELPEQEMTPERIADVWERLQRIKTVREFEKLLAGAAAKQIEP